MKRQPEVESANEYLDSGEACARALEKRGPIRFDEDGDLDRAITDAYERTGFYVFENVIDDPELAELDADRWKRGVR